MKSEFYNVRSFSTFEALVDSFVTETGVFFPKLSYGSGGFFQGFSGWLNSEHQTANYAFITPEPSQALSLPNVGQILSSALKPLFKDKAREHISEYLEKYGLPQTVTNRPVTTLSGGEMLLLNYAKAEAQAEYSQGFYASNPIFWLNASKYHYWQKLSSLYKAHNKPIEVFVLEGDQYFNDDSCDLQHVIQPLELELEIDNPKALFPEIRFPMYSPESAITYAAQGSLKLKSPFIITGDNGVGKSILSKLLTGITPVHNGTLAIKGANAFNTCRLIFQESITQGFTKTPTELLANVFCSDFIRGERAQSYFNRLFQRLFKAAAEPEHPKLHSLLSLKLALIAERLADDIALLLLDEPSWGLSCNHAQQLVYETCTLAHELGVGVGIVSHQPTWHSFAHSQLALKRGAPQQVALQYESIAHVTAN